MKGLVFTFLFILSLSSLGFAQSARGKGSMTAEQRARQSTEVLTKQLNLTEQQTSELYKLQLEHAQKMDIIRSQRTQGQPVNSKERTALIIEHDARLNKLLTADQQKQYADYRRQQMERMRAKTGAGRKGARAADTLK